MEHRWLRITMTAAALAAVLTIGAGAASLGTGTVRANSLNLRSAPSSDASTLGLVYGGSKVDVLDDLGDGWLKVSYEGKTGYMSAEYVTVGIGTEVLASGMLPTSDLGNGKVVLESGMLNIRDAASPTASQVGAIPNGAVVALENYEDGWFQVSYGSVSGYVNGDYIEPTTEGVSAYLGNGKVTLAYGMLNIRATASSNGSQVGSIPNGAVIVLENYVDGWYQVTYGKTTGYISSDYVVPTTEAVTAAVETKANSNGEKIVAMAKQYLGCPYVYGATGPKAFDCSGFTYYLYKQMGYTINRTASTQLNGNGVSVSKSDLQLGDLVFFRDYGCSKSASHVGMYIGGGQFIHASSSKSGACVRINNLSDSWYAARYAGAKRIMF